MSSTERTWIPEEYSDEIMPGGRADIQDWIEVRADGCFLKSPPDCEWPGRQLKDGEIVVFTTHVDHGDTYCRFVGGAFQVDDPMPAKARMVIACGDSDTLAYDMETFEAQLREMGYDADENDMVISYYDFPSFSFRFDAVNKAFFRCEDEKEEAVH